MSRAKQIGTKHETDIKNYLIERGYKNAKRLVLRGTSDEGDLSLGDGYPVVIEAKGGKGAVGRIPASLDELEAEIANVGADTGFLVVKRNGTTNVGRYYAIMPLERMMEEIEHHWPPPHELQVEQPKRKIWPRVR